ncbi:MAG: hypothetical protein QUU85_19850, partial [Candidatus Eisenbacteria bacterium]|nr:hypothetical protein [Candidatus Eisenbacteria bacterium]
MRPAILPAALTMLACACLLATSPAGAEELRSVSSGMTTIHWDTSLLTDLDFPIVAVTGDLDLGQEDDHHIEDPHWTFAITRATDLTFRVDHGIALPYGMTGGAIRHAGAITFLDTHTGARHALSNFSLVYRPGIVDGPGGPHPTDQLLLVSQGETVAAFRVDDSMLDFRPGKEQLQVHYMNIAIADAWAEAIGRPDLAGWTVANAEVVSDTRLIESIPSPGEPYTPRFDIGIDVSLGGIRSIQQIDREGTYPDGVTALSFATTACNVGDVDVPWLAPMQENHPVIAMALYRLLDGRLSQIGFSDMKHGFYALSNNDCSACQNPSDGSFLGVGCSDTYGVMNNSDRNYLAPRSEVNGFTAKWDCQGSHFAGGLDDCVRHHNGSGHGPIDHRLFARDADLGNDGATYYYEGYYLVREDVAKANNIGYRRCTMSWSGSVWNFTTPSNDNPLVEGPVIDTWGDRRTVVPAGDGDGNLTLAVRTQDLGDGMFRYEYAVFNFDSDREARSLQIPVGSLAGITNIGFHDPDLDPADDWQVSLENGVLTWSTDAFGDDPGANALGFGILFNFWFDAPAAPVDGEARLGLFKPYDPDFVTAATIVPAASSASVDEASLDGRRLLLDPLRPNPAAPGTTISFELAAAGPVRMQVFDPSGRLVAEVADEAMAAGRHERSWDGRDAGGLSLIHISEP